MWVVVHLHSANYLPDWKITHGAHQTWTTATSIVYFLLMFHVVGFFFLTLIFVHNQAIQTTWCLVLGFTNISIQKVGLGLTLSLSNPLHTRKKTDCKHKEVTENYELSISERKNKDKYHTYSLHWCLVMQY